MVVRELVSHNSRDVFAAVRSNEVCTAGVVGKELGHIVDAVVERDKTPTGITEVLRRDHRQGRHFS